MKAVHGILGAAVLCTAALAWAGSRVALPVQVDTGNRWAYGAIGSARNSSNTLEYIGCKVFTYMSGSATMTCSGRDASNRYASCSSSAAPLVEAARSLAPDSYIRFTWLSTGECATLQVEHYSDLEPKQ